MSDARVVGGSAHTGAGVTMTQIARLAGVSRPLVSKVLHGGTTTASVSEETADRVRAMATTLGYRPNAAAMAVSRGCFNTIGLVMGTGAHTSALAPRMLQGILDETHTLNLHLTVDRLPDEKLTNDGFVPKILREVMADGLLIDYTHNIPARMLELFSESGTPCVWLNSQQATDAVYPDDRDGGQRLTRHLLDMGHRRIVYVDYTAGNHYSSAARHAGYVEALASAGIPALSVRESRHETERLPATLEWLRRVKPTAVVCYGGCWDVVTAAHLLGLVIPRDLSVVTFAGDPLLAYGLRITTARTPEYEEGGAAVRMLVRKIAEPGRRLAPQALPYTVVAQDSSGPPREASGCALPGRRRPPTPSCRPVGPSGRQKGKRR